MKRTDLIFPLIIVMVTYFSIAAVNIKAQDSVTTRVKFHGFENEELETLSQFLNIDYHKMVCKDTAMRGKHFVFSVAEFKNGKPVDIDTLVKSQSTQDTLVIKGDTMIYMHFEKNKITFHENKKSISVEFVGQLQDNEYKLLVKYSGIFLTTKFKGNKKYLLTKTNACGKDGAIITVDRRMPVLAYTPPLAFDNNMSGSICALRAETIENWYEKCEIEHYYLIYLTIQEPE